MPVKLRLQRHGKKGNPFYWMVAADSRSKRDGRYLEKIGTYNPNTNPATVNIDIEKAISWLEKGAQPTDTARTLLSYKGAMFKHHLNGGVRKGAFTQEEANKKFDKWIKEKAAKINLKKEGLSKHEAELKAKRLDAEKATSEKRITDAAEAALAAEQEAAQEPAGDVTTPQATAEETPAEAVVEETPSEAAVEETPAEAAVEETPAKAVAEETPAEAAAEETPAKAVVEETPSEAAVDETPAETAAEETSAKDISADSNEKK